MVDAVAYSMIFLLIFQDRGIINFVLSKLGIDAIPWLKQSIPAKLLIVIVVTWRWTGYNMILFLAAMQNIPEDYYEAATIDGANALQQFTHITIPMLKPVILFSTISTKFVVVSGLDSLVSPIAVDVIDPVPLSPV